MDIVIIGSGNVASVLGRKFKEAGHQILQVVSRNAVAASALAYEWDTDSTNYLSTIHKNADIYLIAVTDTAIAAIVQELRLPGKVVAHTAASVPQEILAPVTNHFGIFYPLQSLRKETTILPAIPVFYDGIDETTKVKLRELAFSIAAENTNPVTADSLQKLHVAAVFVSNFTNHLYQLAASYCKKEGLDFSQLWPLILETANRLKVSSPDQSQTGPAIRHDKETLQKHLNLLENHPHLKDIYITLTESIQEYN